MSPGGGIAGIAAIADREGFFEAGTLHFGNIRPFL